MEIAERDGFVIDTDHSRLDVAMICDFFAASYLGEGVDLEGIAPSIAKSRAFGLYAPDGRQAGFGRVRDRRITVCLTERRLRAGGVSRARAGQIAGRRGYAPRRPGQHSPMDAGNPRRARSVLAVWIYRCRARKGHGALAWTNGYRSELSRYIDPN